MNPATIQSLKASIEAFRAELGDDDADTALRADHLEGCTSIDDVLSRLVRSRIRARANGIGAAEAAKVAAEHYQRRMDVAEREEAHANRLIWEVLTAAGLEKFAVPEGKISIIAGRPSVVIEDAEALPQGYWKPARKPLTAEIKTALLAGEAIPGASLSFGKPSVRIS
jgi:hypothetical protein